MARVCWAPPLVWQGSEDTQKCSLLVSGASKSKQNRKAAQAHVFQPLNLVDQREVDLHVLLSAPPQVPVFVSKCKCLLLLTRPSPSPHTLVLSPSRALSPPSNASAASHWHVRPLPLTQWCFHLFLSPCPHPQTQETPLVDTSIPFPSHIGAFASSRPCFHPEMQVPPLADARKCHLLLTHPFPPPSHIDALSLLAALPSTTHAAPCTAKIAALRRAAPCRVTSWCQAASFRAACCPPTPHCTAPQTTMAALQQACVAPA
eukprot:scaffold117390_cov16-Tisochrysis_lutea.AAC.1